MMSIRLLKRCGEALYGSQWQSAIARDLKVSDRTVRRWIAGTSDVPSGIYSDLLMLCYERSRQLDELTVSLLKPSRGTAKEEARHG